MRPVKRIEIVIDSLELRKLLRSLEQVGVSGYTVIQDAAGMGDRGGRAGDQLSDALKNSYVITACPEEQLQPLIDAIRPLLKRFGGICLVSDAQWIVH
jgi:nitrogen regulatory protein PII